MYTCTHCDAQSAKWNGRCLECGKWGTLEEVAQRAQRVTKGPKGAAAEPSTRLSDAAEDAERGRIQTGIAELDRVLGGGLVRGSLALLAGEPGIGKSTLVAMAAGAVKPTLYISGEESGGQLADRFARLGVAAGETRFLEAYPLETLLATIEKEKPALAIIDSIQTISSEAIDSAAGTPAMVRYATNALLELAKRSGVSILIIGQVTKDGAVAGPKTLEHLVDVVLTIEGDPVHAYRLLRAGKNRFGSTHEVGVFEMTGKGLATVANPSAVFLAERQNLPGSVITATAEGSRVFLVEVQALVEKSAYATPVRRASGFDGNRLQMLCAILSKRAGVKLGERDVYVNVIGGLSLEEPAADLAVCAAIKSAAKDEALATPTVIFGEVGLGGEVRTVRHADRRLAEAKRLGITRSITPEKVKNVKGL